MHIPIYVGGLNMRNTGNIMKLAMAIMIVGLFIGCGSQSQNLDDNYYLDPGKIEVRVERMMTDLGAVRSDPAGGQCPIAGAGVNKISASNFEYVINVNINELNLDKDYVFLVSFNGYELSLGDAGNGINFKVYSNQENGIIGLRIYKNDGNSVESMDIEF
jgi:hypothetical protein